MLTLLQPPPHCKQGLDEDSMPSDSGNSGSSSSSSSSSADPSSSRSSQDDGGSRPQAREASSGLSSAKDGLSSLDAVLQTLVIPPSRGNVGQISGHGAEQGSGGSSSGDGGGTRSGTVKVSTVEGGWGLIRVGPCLPTCTCRVWAISHGSRPPGAGRRIRQISTPFVALSCTTINRRRRSSGAAGAWRRELCARQWGTKARHQTARRLVWLAGDP